MKFTPRSIALCIVSMALSSDCSAYPRCPPPKPSAVGFISVRPNLRISRPNIYGPPCSTKIGTESRPRWNTPTIRSFGQLLLELFGYKHFEKLDPLAFDQTSDLSSELESIGRQDMTFASWCL